METTIEVLVIAAAAWPAARLCAVAGYRRAHPGAAARLAALAVGWTVAGGAAALASPLAARALAAVSALAAAALAWRARPAWGRARGLPPGSLTLGPPAGAYRDDLFYLAQARRHGAVFKVGGFRAGQVCVLGLAHGMELLRAHEGVLAAPPMPYSRLIPRGFIRYMGNADHETYRRLLRPAFAREVVAAESASFAGLAHRRLARLAAASGGRAAAPDDTLTALALDVLLRLVYGLDPEDAASVRVRALYGTLDHRPGHRAGDADAGRALAELGETLRAAARRTPPPAALAAVERASPGALADPTVLGNLVFIPRVAASDLGDGLLWLTWELARHPEWLARLRDDAPGGVPAAEAAAERVVLETLRLHQSEYIVRRATADLDLGGHRVPRGWLVRVLVRESHRDPATFPNPHRFDPDRFLGRTFARCEYAPFGGDRHACLGDHLTRALGAAVARRLALGWEIAVAADGPSEMGRLHWRPSRRFRVRLTPRAGGAP